MTTRLDIPGCIRFYHAPFTRTEQLSGPFWGKEKRTRPWLQVPSPLSPLSSLSPLWPTSLLLPWSSMLPLLYIYHTSILTTCNSSCQRTLPNKQHTQPHANIKFTTSPIPPLIPSGPPSKTTWITSATITTTYIAINISITILINHYHHHQHQSHHHQHWNHHPNPGPNHWLQASVSRD